MFLIDFRPIELHWQCEGNLANLTFRHSVAYREELRNSRNEKGIKAEQTNNVFLNMSEIKIKMMDFKNILFT